MMKKHWNTLNRHFHPPHMRIIAYALTAVFALVTIVVFMNTYLYDTRASQSTASMSFNPKSIIVVPGQVKEAGLQIFAQGGGRIVGVDINLTAKGVARIESIGTLRGIGDTSAVFTEIIRTKNRIYGVFMGPAPGSVYIPFTVTASNFSGNGSVSVDIKNSQVVGKVDGYEYLLKLLRDLDVNVVSVSK